MNMAQIILAQRSIRSPGRIAIVGDDRQSIYSFRGAASGIIDTLKSQLEAEELPLNTTYRCPQSIVEYAQWIVPDFHAHDTAPMGSIETHTEHNAIAMMQPGDFVLSRKNAPLAGVCLRILRQNKRARIQGKDIGAGLIALVNRWKANSMVEFFTRLRNWEEREIKRTEAAGRSSAEERIEQIHDKAETLRALAEGLTGVPELRTRIEGLFDDSNKEPAIMCSSIHKSKGLESARVFILKQTLNSIPIPCTCGHWSHASKPCGRCSCTEYVPNPRRLIEERNLEYVAVTRSKSRLVWIDSKY